ncbi:MAG: 2-amino-4-hydroxy-6-hydroxymethyldihydropteridine diphosphokinase [Hyphomicrobiales bacterium]
MIFVGLGSNLNGPWGTPKQCLARALITLRNQGIKVVKSSGIYSSKAYGRTGIPDYVNSVIQIETFLSPHALLYNLQQIEHAAARKRGQRWGSRTLDLDLLDWNKRICGPDKESGPVGGSDFRPLSLPHPGIVNRPFVIIPLAEIAPRWHHPINGKTASQLALKAQLSPEGRILGVI